MMNARYLALTAVIALLVGACDESPTGVGRQVASLLSVSPAGGAGQVDSNSQIVIEFTHSMMAGMEAYAEVHEGDVMGPLVAGTWVWEPGEVTVKARFTHRTTVLRKTLIFTPEEALLPGTQYTIHLGGNMRATDGKPIRYDVHGLRHMAGQWAPEGMMGSTGTDGGRNHMTADWQHANGSFGMTFTFKTGSIGELSSRSM